MQENEGAIAQLVDNFRAGVLSRRQLIGRLTAVGISATGVSAILTSASRRSNSSSPSEVQVADDTSQHLQLHSQHLSHQTQGQLGALYDDYAELAVVEDSMYSAPVVGRAAIIARKSMGLSATSSVQVTVNNRIAMGNQVIVEWVTTGVHTGDLPGLPATGRSFTLRGLTVVVREHGKIVRESLYYDVADLYRQLEMQQE
jgi:steroid delta-isomerase-like uncharacterized protein